MTELAAPSDNNPAERSLRPLVISRKISGGTRSEQGTETKMGPGFPLRHLARPGTKPPPGLPRTPRFPSSLNSYLLDIHCPEGEVHKQEIMKASGKVRLAFRGLAGCAAQARELRLEVENEQEGLEATRAKYLNLVGDEETAKSLGDLGRIETWHKVAKQRLDGWRTAFQIPAGPELPTSPQLQTDLPIADYVPSDTIPAAVDEYRKAVGRAADELVAALHTESDSRLPKVESLRAEIQASIGDNMLATPELAVEAEQYRVRLSMLEQQATELAALDKTISDDLKAMDGLIDQATKSWADLRKARQLACTAVNKSMTSFFVRVTPDSVTTDIDQLLSDLRTGTYLHEATLQETRDTLDRKSFIRAAIRRLQFPTSGEGENLNEASMNARKIACEAMDREKFDGIAELTVLRPSDGIEILRKQPGESPVTFDNLTEGLKALAIKELSFAALTVSSRLRINQKMLYQQPPFSKIWCLQYGSNARPGSFIIASHDANVVVSGDMERVIVLPPTADDEPITGTLFDPSIRAGAIALLEGGDRAFELRRRRYGDYG